MSDYVTVFKEEGGLHTQGETGDVLITTDTLTTPEWVPSNALLLQSSYPALFAKTGVTGDGSLGAAQVWSDMDYGVGRVYALAWDSSETYLAVGGDSYPFLAMWKRVGNSLVRLSAIDYLPPEPSGSFSSFILRTLGWSGNGRRLVVSFSSSPGVVVYEREGDSFSHRPDSLSLSLVQSTNYDPISIDYSGRFVALGSQSAPYLYVLDIGPGSISLLQAPDTPPTSDVRACAWSLNAEFLAVATTASPYVLLYQRNGVLLEKQANPATLPAGYANGCAWDSSSTFLSIGHNTTPFVTIYQRQGTSLTKLANPASLPPSIGQHCAWDPKGPTLLVTHATSPFISAYDMSGGSPVKTVAPAFSAYVRRCEFSPSGTFLVTNTAQYLNASYDVTTQFLTPKISTTAPMKAYIKS